MIAQGAMFGDTDDAAVSRPDTKKPNGAFERAPRPWYQPPDIGEQPPTDNDNWDIPDTEVAKLALLFPGAVQIVKT